MKTPAFANFLKAFQREPRGEGDCLVVWRGERAFQIAVKRSINARRLTLRISGATGDIVLTMPARTSFRQAQDFAERHAEWLANRLAHIPRRTPFAPGEKIPLRGVEHVLRHCPILSGAPARSGSNARSGRQRFAPAANSLISSGASPIICGGRPAATSNRRCFATRRERGSARSASPLRDTSSRWGSCSAKGALNFSWRPILAPPLVLDYLAAHETAHLRHHDHSEKFWALTKSLCPRTAEAEAWLKAHGAQLHRYGRAVVPSISGE